MSLVVKHGKTLSSTLEKYNSLAATMDPPKPRLSWDDVTSLEFVSDIMILWGCDDVHQKPWVKPHLHDATQAWYKLQWAHEEIKTVRLKACQVWASTKHEEAHLQTAIESTQLADPSLVEYISITSKYCLNVNAHLHTKLTQLNRSVHFLTGVVVL